MKLALAPWGATIDELADVAVSAEARGFNSVWTSESHRSSFVPLAAIAARTKEVGIGTSIALAFARSPLITALTALDLDELSGGRFILGLGTGVRKLNELWHGVAFDHPVARLRDRVGLIRYLMTAVQTGEAVHWEDSDAAYEIRNFIRPFAPARARVPIYLAGVGAKMLSLVGEIADGWLSHELNSRRFVREHVIPALRRGLHRAGRENTDIVRVGAVCCAVDRNPSEARRRAANTVAFYATVRTYTPFFSFHGFEQEVRTIQRLFSEGGHASALKGVTDSMVQAFTIAGTPDQVRKGVHAYSEMFDVIRIHPPRHQLGDDEIRASQAAILEVFGM